MPLPVCNKEPFVGTQQFEIPIGTTITKLERQIKLGFPSWIMTVCRRPAVPLYGLNLNAITGVYDYAVSTQANVLAILAVWKDAYLASLNYTNDDLVSPQQYSGGDFGGYIYKKIGSDICLQNRYNEVVNKVIQFFTLHAAIAALTFADWQDLTFLINKVMNESDKQMYIPPGVYTFDNGSASNAALEAWFAADPNLSAFYSVELVTT